MNILNNGIGFRLFQEESMKVMYIDKSMLIDTFFKHAIKTNKYVCITRPRRFGKSVCANMLAAFFDKSVAKDSDMLFSGLAIGIVKKTHIENAESSDRQPLCWKYQGRKNVLHVNFNNIMDENVGSYDEFLKGFKRLIAEDIVKQYPDKHIDTKQSISKILRDSEDSFVFVIDEWDSVFEQKFMTDKNKEDYILFLKNLLKDQPYVDFVYMTGILPIAKYTSGSPLNMFTEFSAFMDDIFYPYFGLTQDEIAGKMYESKIEKPSLKELELWYDGYIRDHDGVHVYNPASVSKALAGGVCRDFWSGTGRMNEVKEIIQNNVKEVREDVVRMASGETLDIELSGFATEETQISTRDEILSAMVVYGFLTYHDKKLCIPNHELILKFRQALASEPLGLKQTLDESKKLLDATLERRHADIARYIEDLHDEKIPFFKYNDENSLACVITIGYLSAMDRYAISREDKAGKGYVDFLFVPLKENDTAIILELKYNHSAKSALKSIHEREYIKRLKDYKNVLLVGINYSEKTKKHTCLTELVVQ